MVVNMDPVVLQGVYLTLAAAGGAALTKLVDWLLSRGDRRLNREDAIAAANDKLAETLRAEVRADNEALRERLRMAEDRIATLVGQVAQLSNDNHSLRGENMHLQEQNGAANERITQQSRVIADQALKLSTMQNDLTLAQDRIAVLENALNQARQQLGEAGKRPGTGPLGAD
jgi:chromosome segregation ATPase